MNEFNFDRSIDIGNNAYVAHFNELLQRFTPRDWETFQIILSSGVSEECEAKRLIVDLTIKRHDKCISEDTAWLSIQALIKLGVLRAEKISTGYRNFKLLIATDLGKHLYRITFKKEPAVQEHITLLREHASLEHGYMIKDVKKILFKRGVYREVSTSRKLNRILLNEGRSVIPDVIAKTYGIENEYYEVECGTHNQAEFNAKCNKLLGVTSDINIIGKNRDTITRILVPQIERWIKSDVIGLLQQIGGTVTVYGMTDFARRRKTYSLDLSKGKLICHFKPEKEDY
ncbi:MAG: hypothetical protein J6K62_01105 [Clostridia bacterium]|nr:hypothetical protein [Clostridia bacterium]